MVNIALDAMGGDHAPYEAVLGATLAVKEFPITVTLVGQQDKIRKTLQKLGEKESDRLKIHHASEVVDMAESPSQAFRKKKDSSINVGIRMVKDGNADGFVSAGNTGAIMAASILLLGKIPNIDRPAITAILPSLKENLVMLDMGSNMDSKPHHLEQFALMGHYYSNLVMGVQNPRVGLLNIGEEEDKGDELSKASYELLTKLPINFIGNIEGKVLHNGVADVVVCDGFVGNTVLKFGQGIIEVFFKFFKQAFKSSLIAKIGTFFLYPTLKKFKRSFDYEEFGGAPLLGVNGITVIAHGKSHGKAIKNTIRNAVQAHEAQMIDKITGAVS